MSRPSAFYTFRVVNQYRWKHCLHCDRDNITNARTCRGCRRTLRRRPPQKKDRSIDAKLRATSDLLDEWLTKLKVASGRIEYYRRRMKTLYRDKERIAAGIPRPKREKPPSRAVRVRPEPEGGTLG